MMETSAGSLLDAENLMVLGVEKSHVVPEVGSVTVMARAEEKRARAERANEYCILKDWIGISRNLKDCGKEIEEGKIGKIRKNVVLVVVLMSG
jgi:hypothetical protein